MQYRILGPLEVVGDDATPVVLGALERVLLVALLLAHGRVVPTHKLARLLWGDDPPRSLNALQVHVSRLRRKLEAASGRTDLLVSEHRGYLLRCQAEELDAARFEDLLKIDEGNTPEHLSRVLAEALSLWRGPALSGLGADVVFAEAARLEELRLVALERRISADLALGRHLDLCAELEVLCQEHPMREALQGQLMLALYRCGRQADALATYRRTRAMLAEELGIDPSHELQELELAILNQREGIAAPLSTGVDTEAALAEPPSGHEERKTVSVVCLELTAGEDDEDPEAMRAVLEGFTRDLHAIFDRYGGTFQYALGGIVTAVFGVPVLHEDDAVRGVRAALEAVEAIVAGMTPRAAVATGKVLVGGDYEHELVGSVTRRAARLCQAASNGEVLIDYASLRLTGDAIVTEPAGDSAHRALSVRQGYEGRSMRLSSPMVGRQRQLHRLTEVFDDAVDEQACHLFSVIGAAGVGKSRLVAEFLAVVGERATVLEGRCLPYGSGITYRPIVTMIAQAAGLSGGEDPRGALEKLCRIAPSGRDQEAVTRCLAYLLGLDDEPPSVGEIAWAFRRGLEALSRERPVIAVIDDVQWAQPTLLELICHVADYSKDHPLLVLCMARPEHLEVHPDWGGGKANATTLTIEPLRPEDCDSLVDNLLGLPDLSAPLRHRIAEATGGNPFFVEETVAMLIEEGILSQVGGQWRAAGELGRFVPPASVQQLLAARLDRLGLAEKEVIGRASVEGQVFHQAPLRDLTPEPLRPQIAACLGLLERKDLIRSADADFPEQEAYRFRHLLVRDAAYESLPRALRSQLHERFADWLERVASDRFPDYDEIAGYHLEQAYNEAIATGHQDERTAALAERAATHLLRAGAQIEQSRDAPTAISVLTRALHLVSRGSVDYRDLCLLGEAYSDVGDGDALGGAFDRASQLATVLGSAAQAHVRVRHAFALGAAGGDVTEVALETDAELLERSGDHLALARWNHLRGWALGDMWRNREAAEAHEAAGNHYKMARNRRGESTSPVFAAASLVWTIPVAEALELLADLARNVGDRPVIHGHLLEAQAVAMALAGQFSTARSSLKESIDIAAKLGQPLPAAVRHVFVPMILQLADDQHGAVLAFDEAERLLEPYGPFFRARTAADAARARALVGDVDGAQARIGLAKELASPSELSSAVYSRSAEALVLAHNGREAEVMILLDELSELVEGRDHYVGLFDQFLDRAEVFRLLGHRSEALESAHSALAIADSKGATACINIARSRIAALTRGA